MDGNDREDNHTSEIRSGCSSEKERVHTDEVRENKALSVYTILTGRDYREWRIGRGFDEEYHWGE